MRKRIIRYKVYYDRSGGYLNYVKTIFVIAMAYKLLEDKNWGIWVYDHRFTAIPIAIVSYILSRIIIGYYDKKWGIREREIGEYNKTDPNLRAILGKLNDIIKKLDDNSTDS